MYAGIPPHLAERVLLWPGLRRWQRRELAADFRRLGLSYREIMALVPVARGTLSGWMRDVVLDEEQRARLAARRPSPAALLAAAARRRACNRERDEAVMAAARAEARALMGDAFWVAGVVAYWAEGAKTTRVQFSNSDPALLALFLRWAMTDLDASADDFTIRLHLHGGQDEDESKLFWAAITGLGLDQFRKTFVKAEGTGHRKKLLYRGTAAVSLRRSGSQLLRVLGWIDAFRADLPRIH